MEVLAAATGSGLRQKKTTKNFIFRNSSQLIGSGGHPAGISPRHGQVLAGLLQTQRLTSLQGVGGIGLERQASMRSTLTNLVTSPAAGGSTPPGLKVA